MDKVKAAPSPDLRVVARWEGRLQALQRGGLIYHSVMVFDRDVAGDFVLRKALRTFLSEHLQYFALKFEHEHLPNGHTLHHAHLLTPPDLASSLFFGGIGAKPEPQKFGRIVLPPPLLPQTTPIERPSFIKEVHVRLNGPHPEQGWTPLARYLSKPSGLQNGLPSVLEKGVASRGRKSKSSEPIPEATSSVQKRPRSLLEVAEGRWGGPVSERARNSHSLWSLGIERNKREK